MVGKLISLCIFAVFLGLASANQDTPANVSASAQQVGNYEDRVRTLMLANGYKVWEKVGYYKYHRTPANWVEARQICMNEGANLAVPTSQEEVDHLVQIYRENPRSNVINPEQTLLGIHDMRKEGEWETVYGKLLKDSKYPKWATNQPSHGTMENCGAMFNNGLLNDYPCERVNNFICERKFEIPNPDKKLEYLQF